MSDYPLISVILATMGSRRRFVHRAIAQFAAQDYPHKELIILDETDRWGNLTSLAVPNFPWIRYCYLDRLSTSDLTFTLGAKRNLLCSLAQGEIICQWDDDDIYRPDRLSRQAAPLIANEADISGLVMDMVLNLNDFSAWRCGPTLHQEIFANDVHGGTLMYHRLLWNNHACFENKSSGEDGGFLRLVRSQGARLAKVENNGSFIYVRHESTWPLPPQGYQHEDEWQQVPIEQYLSEDEQAFYRSLQRPVPVG